jgi:hypothetical protein
LAVETKSATDRFLFGFGAERKLVAAIACRDLMLGLI